MVFQFLYINKFGRQCSTNQSQADGWGWAKAVLSPLSDSKDRTNQFILWANVRLSAVINIWLLGGRLTNDNKANKLELTFAKHNLSLLTQPALCLTLLKHKTSITRFTNWECQGQFTQNIKCGFNQDVSPGKGRGFQYMAD